MKSIEIKNFRGFSQLTVERLGRVNLVVGKNNSGKSSLLEALRLYFSGGAPAVIVSLLWSRDEMPEHRSTLRTAELPEWNAEQFFRMFHLHHNPTYTPHPIIIGPMDGSDEKFLMRLAWYSSVPSSTGALTWKELPATTDDLPWNSRPAWVIEAGEYHRRPIFLDTLATQRVFSAHRGESPFQYLPVNGVSSTQLGRLYDRVALAGRMGDALSALRLMSRDVDQVLLVGEGSSRQVLVKVPGAAEPVPLRSMGDGMNRILGIILALVNAKGGVLLADEVENGIHYSVMPELWKLVFRLAQELDVQVFATTHSWDCIEGFQRAAVADRHNLGMLIRLERRKGDIQSTLFDEDELTIATREHIEVR